MKGLVVCSATSSSEQIDIVDRQKGTPNFSAARAAWISPSACCIPVRPTGARATGMVAGRPTISDAVLRFDMSTATFWRSFRRAKSVVFSRKVCSV